jgi:hypothetical protein
MNCFLCDRSARWRTPVIPVINPFHTDESVSRFTPRALSVCGDCDHRLQSVQYDEMRKTYIVTLKHVY